MALRLSQAGRSGGLKPGPPLGNYCPPARTHEDGKRRSTGAAGSQQGEAAPSVIGAEGGFGIAYSAHQFLGD